MKKSAKTFLILLLIILTSTFVLVYVMSKESKDPVITLTPTPCLTPTKSKSTPKPRVDEEITLRASKEPGFYEEGFLLELNSSGEGCKILYTITSPESYEASSDGKVSKTGERYMYQGGVLPSIDNLDGVGYEASYIYDGPIKIWGKPYSEKDPVRITIIRACGIDEDNEIVTDVYTFTYIVGDKSLYGSYFVCICIDEESLYNYEKGILVQGKCFEEERLRNPKRAINNFFPRNYTQRGAEWEREAHLQMFNKEGKLVVDQRVGLRINGGMSRHFSIKSLKVSSKKKYGNTKIEYEIFDGLKNNFGERIDTFDKLIFRNSGNDLDGLMFKDVFLHRLAGLVGLDYQEGAPCSVYINGKYYSLMNIRESLDSDYIESRYGIPKDFVDMVGISYQEGFKFVYKVSSGSENAADRFKEDMLRIVNTDFSQCDISEIDKIIDVENFIKYMAYQIYIGNTDWPHNNMLAWRYWGIPNNSVKAMDGKWRFLIKDLDYRSVFVNYSHNTLEAVLENRKTEGPCIGEVLKACLRNAEFKEKFVNYLLYLCDEITSSRVDNLLNEMKELRQRDIEIFWKYRGGNESQWIWRMNELRTFGEKRRECINSFLES